MNNQTPEASWAELCRLLETLIGSPAFGRWFRQTRLAASVDQKALLQVPDTIHQLWIESNFMDSLKEAFFMATGETWEVVIEVNEEMEHIYGGEPTAGGTGPLEAQQCDAGKAETSAAKADSLFPDVEMRATSGARPQVQPPPAPEDERVLDGSFENFVIGANNQHAAAAAEAVAKAPGQAHNPLLIYSDAGLGKTHLLRSIGRYCLHSGLRVMQLECIRFIDDYIDSVRSNSISQFKARFRKVDVLLLDDIQWLAGKERTQEEFFHIFNALRHEGKQIVIAADQAPAEICGLQERLLSRFDWGLTVQITPPEYETRLAILRKRADAMGIAVPHHLLDFIALRIRAHVRRLIGALYRVGSEISLCGIPSIDRMTELLQDWLNEESRRGLNAHLIQKRVAETWKVTEEDLVGRRRTANLTLPRHAAMYLIRSLLGSTYAEIGHVFGRDHSSVMSGEERIRKKLETDEVLRRQILQLEKELRRSAES